MRERNYASGSEALAEVLAVSGLAKGAFGLPGSGKSFYMTTLGLDGRKVERVQCSPDASGLEMRGAVLPLVGKVGQWGWVDGPMARAVRHGSILVLEEIGRASEDVLAWALAAADSAGSNWITIPYTGEKLVPAAGFEVRATMNNHPRELDAALARRFVWVEVNEVAPEFFDQFGDLARQVQSAMSAGFGTARDWLAVQQMRKAEVPLRRALDLVFGSDGRELSDSMAIAAGQQVSR